MKISDINLLEGTIIKVSGQKLVMQEFGSLINKKLLGVHIDRTLSFDEHVSNLFKKVGQVI